MNRQLGAIALVAGTCIGSGMIALPLMLSKLGLIPSLGLMLITWLVMYYSAFISLELNLQAGQGLSLGALGQRYSGRLAASLGYGSIKLLSYALLSVFLYGGTSVLQDLLATQWAWHLNFATLLLGFTLFSALLLSLPLKWVDYLNRFLFLGLLLAVFALIAGLVSQIRWSHLPLWSPHQYHWQDWRLVIPVVFTSFGFQVIFHTLTHYCRQHVRMLKRAFFWGSLIPALVYAIWTCSVLSVIHHNQPSFYQHLVHHHVDVGDLVYHLSRIAQWPSLKLVVWWVSFLAILTSVIGVGVGLCDSLRASIHQKLSRSSKGFAHALATLITILPAYLVASLVPDAFINMLGFAGMILSVIAIGLPLYLLYRAKFTIRYFPSLNYLPFLMLSGLAGLIVIVCEVSRLFL